MFFRFFSITDIESQQPTSTYSGIILKQREVGDKRKIEVTYNLRYMKGEPWSPCRAVSLAADKTGDMVRWNG